MGWTGTDYSAINISLLTVKMHKTMFETAPLFPSPWHPLSNRLPKTNTWEFLSLSLFLGWGVAGQLYHVVCRILVPQPGMEPRAPTVKTLRPHHGNAREYPNMWKFQEVLFL